MSGLVGLIKVYNGFIVMFCLVFKGVSFEFCVIIFGVVFEIFILIDMELFWFMLKFGMDLKMIGGCVIIEFVIGCFNCRMVLVEMIMYCVEVCGK